MSQTRDIFIFTPTPNEFAAVSRHLDGAGFRNFQVRVIESGPGAVNAAFQTAAAAAPLLAAGRPPFLILGAGTCGSLTRTLAGGDLIASAEAVIADWIMEDGDGRTFSPYGRFDYRPLTPETLEAMTLRCPAPLIDAWLGRLEQAGFKRGRLMTSGAFVAGLENKLARGRDFQALGCDMESGVFAYAAQHLLGGRPWLNLRVVADTLDEKLTDYFTKEAEMTEILGARTRLALSSLDQLLF